MNDQKIVDLGAQCTESEVRELELIQTRVSCARQAMRADMIPPGTSEDIIRTFVQAAIESLAQYTWLEKKWWDEMKEKYNLPRDKNVWIDFNRRMFYIIPEHEVEPINEL